MPFAIKFQLLRLAWNGYLPPPQVQELAYLVQDFRKSYTLPALVHAIKATAVSLPFAGPDTDQQELSPSGIMHKVEQKAKAFKYAGSIYEHVRRHEHLGLIHHVHVTPCGTYLQGPTLETKNRVLRKYDRTDRFVRISFLDEHQGRLGHQPDPKPLIIRGKFADILRHGVDISGSRFQYLGELPNHPAMRIISAKAEAPCRSLC